MWLVEWRMIWSEESGEAGKGKGRGGLHEEQARRCLRQFPKVPPSAPETAACWRCRWLVSVAPPAGFEQTGGAAAERRGPRWPYFGSCSRTSDLLDNPTGRALRTARHRRVPAPPPCLSCPSPWPRQPCLGLTPDAITTLSVLDSRVDAVLPVGWARTRGIQERPRHPLELDLVATVARGLRHLWNFSGVIWHLNYRHFDHDPTVRSRGLEEVLLGIGRSGSTYRRHLTWLATINFPLIFFSRG